MNSKQAAATCQTSNALKTGKILPFAMIYPVLEPLLDKDKATQLRTFYNELKRRKISKDVFVNQMRGLVGEHVLKLAVTKLQEQASCSSQTAPKSSVKFPTQQQSMNSSAQSLEQQPQNIQVKLQAEMEELKKEKADLENRLKVALSEVEGFQAQKSSYDNQRAALGEKLKNWIARAVKAESSNSELASKLQTSEAIYIAKVEKLQSIHNAELKKLQTELEELRPDVVNSMDEAVPYFQDGYSTCPDKFAASGVDVTRELFEDYCAELDSSLYIDASENA